MGDTSTLQDAECITYAEFINMASPNNTVNQLYDGDISNFLATPSSTNRLPTGLLILDIHRDSKDTESYSISFSNNNVLSSITSGPDKNKTQWIGKWSGLATFSITSAKFIGRVIYSFTNYKINSSQYPTFASHIANNSPLSVPFNTGFINANVQMGDKYITVGSISLVSDFNYK